MPRCTQEKEEDKEEKEEEEANIDIITFMASPGVKINCY